MSTQRIRLTPIGLFALVATLLAGVAVAPTPAHATTTLAPGDPTPVGEPPPAATSLSSGQAGFDHTTLSWASPTTTVDWAYTEIRMASGTVPPATIADGVQIYQGREDTTPVTVDEPGAVYSFSAFAVDLEGLIAPPVSHTLGGTIVTMTADRTRVAYGDPIILTGYLTDARTGQPLEFRDVQIAAADPVTGEIFDAGQTKAYAGGEFQYVVNPGQNYILAAVFLGDGNQRLGGYSPDLPVQVGMGMHVLPLKKSVKLGKPVVLIVALDPVNPGQAVVIQQLVKGKWKKVASAKAGKKDTMKITLKPKTKGTYTYRATRTGDRVHVSGTSNQAKVKVT